MVKMQVAMNTAKNFIRNYSGHKTGFLLEEAFLSEEKGIWKITYSFFDRNDPLGELLEAVSNTDLQYKKNRRIYRTVEISNEDGEVIGMKAGFSSNSGVAA